MKNAIYEVKCPHNIQRNGSATAIVPGSKSITNRALLLAAMANGTSKLENALTSDDAMYFLECLKTLGFPVITAANDGLGVDVTITGYGGEIPNKNAEIYVGSAGTAARFLTAMLAFSDGDYRIDASEQMKKRPMQPLIDTLRSAGAEVQCLEVEGHFPIRIIGAGNKAAIPDRITVDIAKSSQFLSALLIAAGTLGKSMEIDVTGSHGLSYVDLTVEMMRCFGASVEKQVNDGQIRYRISGESPYQPLVYPIESDLSAAAYFYVLAAVLGVDVAVSGVTDHMLQGDAAFLQVLARMGCHVVFDAAGTVHVVGAESGALTGGFSVDLSAFSDQALTLAAIAPFADAPITITGIGHIRLQECDRIQAIIQNLRTLGIRTEEKADAVTIYPGTPKGGVIETYEDHRVAMAFALTGLRTPGVRISNPSCCKKTFAEYFDVLEQVLKALETP